MVKANVFDRERVGRLPAVLWVWVAAPVVALGFCAHYEAVRAAAGHEADYGRAANRAWYSVAREPATAAARTRLLRYAWYSAALFGVAGIAVVGVRREGRRWVWVRRGTLAAVLAISAAMIADKPRVGGWPSAAPSIRGLGTHAALGGLAMSCVVAASVLRGSVVGRWSRRVGLAVAVAAVASGFVLAGWRPAQVEDLLRQPRDLAHVVAVVGLAVLAAVVGVLRSKRAKRWAAALLLLAGTMAVWTGVLMTIDGSDRTSRVGWLRGPVVQDAGREAGGK